MSGIHDFSIASIDELEKIAIKEVDEEEQWGFLDWFDDTFAGKLDIEENLHDLRAYHEEMMDIHNIGKKKLKSIIKDVTFVDETHAKIWEQINTELTLCLHKLDVLIDTIKPANIAYTESEDLRAKLQKMDARFEKSFHATQSNIALLNKHIEEKLYPPEWWESLLSGGEGFVVSLTRNLICEPLYAIADMVGFEDFARDGVAGMDAIEKWLKENTFDENGYLTGSKLGEITSVVAGIYETVQGISMIITGVVGVVGGGVLSATGVGVFPGGLVVAGSSDLIAMGSGVLIAGIETAGTGIDKLGEPIEETKVDLDDLEDVSTDIEGASGADIDNFIKNNVNSNFLKNVKNAFTSDAKVTVLTEDKIVYRYHGGDSGAKSYWYTPNKTANPGADLALPSGNSYTQVDKLVIPKGTEIMEGTVAPNFGQPGGGYQYYVPDPSVVRKY